MGSTAPNIPVTHSLIAQSNEANLRIDSFISRYFPTYSRSFVQKLIEQERILVNGKSVKQSAIVKPDDAIEVRVPEEPLPYILTPSEKEQAALESLHIPMMHIEKDFFILEKPAHVMMHRPSLHNKTVTLVDWLIHKSKAFCTIGHPERPGIVHRLDKDTSGLLIVPRNNYAHAQFADLFKNRRVKKTYLAVVEGHPEKQGIIDLPIGRDPHHYNKRIVHGRNPRPALTHYKVLEYFESATLVEISPVTGRTHQIRVHFKALGHPLVGDELYGTSSPHIKRQALHATKLMFNFDGRSFYFESPLPEDFKNLLTSCQFFP